MILSSRVIGCAIEVHRALGTGFLESVYDNVLAIELARNNINYKRQFQIEARGRRSREAAKSEYQPFFFRLDLIKAPQKNRQPHQHRQAHENQSHGYLRKLDIDISGHSDTLSIRELKRSSPAKDKIHVSATQQRWRLNKERKLTGTGKHS